MSAREIVIRPVLNGFLVQVGCQSVVFDSVKKMSSELVRYYTNPEKVEKEYQMRALNKMNVPVPQPENVGSIGGLRNCAPEAATRAAR